MDALHGLDFDGSKVSGKTTDDVKEERPNHFRIAKCLVIQKAIITIMFTKPFCLACFVFTLALC